MAGLNRKDWEELDITREEVENLKEALKKEEFRKLLSEYAEEITDPKNRKQYQEDIIQLEAERGVDCAFVNPEPGFVIKTSVDGKKKAFINACKNSLIGKPSSTPVTKGNNRGLNWSIPFSQAPGREDHDKKNNRCVVYDVVFHPDTLHLAEKSSQFKKLVIDTALNAVEDSYNVKLDKKNIKLPKLKFKGLPFATVIRKKSEKQPELTEEDIEFQKNLKYPLSPPSESKPNIKHFENMREDKEKYTIPKYVIKHRSGIDIQEYTYDKNAKINAAIPKELVIEVNLPLLNSTNEVTLDVMEKSINLKCEKPAKYKLDIQLPYAVSEEAGTAVFDKDKRLLIITLPVIKYKTNITDLVREDSGVESDFGDRANSCEGSPVGSVTSNTLGSHEDISRDVLVEEYVHQEEEPDEEEQVPDCALRTKNEPLSFLEAEKHYLFPSFICNVDRNDLCFVLNVKNVVSDSVVEKMSGLGGFHIKFTSIGSGFFPIDHAFFVRFEDGCEIEEAPVVDVWDNNVTLQMRLIYSGTISKYFVGLQEDSLSEKWFDRPIELERIMAEMKLQASKEEPEPVVSVVSADPEEVVISLTPVAEEPPAKDSDDSEASVPEDPKDPKDDKEAVQSAKGRAFSESSGDEVLSSSPVRKSILKNRICRSLSESNADDYVWPSSFEGTASGGSDLFIHEELEEPEESKDFKKTVRFNENIRKQTFRINSSILGQKKKNQKRTKSKKRAMERRASESENSEPEDKERDKRTAQAATEAPENCDVTKAVIIEENENVFQEVKQEDKSEKSEKALKSKRTHQDLHFKSDLIFDLDF